MQIIKIKEREENLTNYCPSCGTCNSDSDGEITPCPHLLFIYLNLADGIMYLRDDLKENLPGEDDLENDQLDYLLSLDLDRSFAIEEVCPGPSQSYFAIGYQFIEKD
jgi:hypothetical protein